MIGDQLEIGLRAHDLPPEWDGTPVEWDDRWKAPAGQIIICPPPPPQRCDSCGTGAEPSTKDGRTWHTTAYRDRYNQIKRGKRPRILTAFRCPDCGHDEIYDGADGTLWCLGPEDYGDRGSYLIAGN